MWMRKVFVLVCAFFLTACGTNHPSAKPAPKTVQVTFVAVDSAGNPIQRELFYNVRNKKAEVVQSMARVTTDGTVTTNLIPGEVYDVTFGHTVREITAPDKPTTITFVVTQP